MIRKSLFLVLFLLLVSGCTPFQVRHVERIPISRHIHSLDITGSNGSMVFHVLPPMEAPYILVEKIVHGSAQPAMKSALSQIQVKTKESGSTLSVHSETPSTLRLGVQSIVVSYQVFLQKEQLSHIKAKTTNGSISVQDFQGALSLLTTNGGVTVREGRGSVEIQTTNGAVHLGSVYLMRGSSVTTTNGAIEAEVALLSGHSYDFETTNGKVALLLSSSSQGDVSLTTSNGKIQVDLPGANYEASNALRFTLKDSGATLRVRTKNGSITLRESFRL